MFVSTVVKKIEIFSNTLYVITWPDGVHYVLHTRSGIQEVYDKKDFLKYVSVDFVFKVLRF